MTRARTAAPRDHSREPREAGFSLLEVMVATAILALSLTAIFSSQVGAVKTAHRAQRVAIAANLARCKMAEIEEQVAREGLPAVDDRDRDGCCEDAEIEGFECHWRIERVVLPDELGLGPEGEEGATSATSGTAAIDTMIAGGDAPGGDIAGMAFSLAFPILKPDIEEQVRRATVEVLWQEGEAERSFDVVQFLVQEPLQEPPPEE